MDKQFVGWREWVSLPGLNIPRVKAKIDTGARTSALHAQNIETFHKAGEDWVRFTVAPIQLKTEPVVTCEARLKDQRAVTNSGGQQETRYVIETLLQIGDYAWPIELTLTDRDTMRFRMLLGRQGLKKHLWVDPGRSYLIGKLTPHHQ